MNFKARLLWLGAAIAIIITVIMRVLFGGWVDWMWFPFSVFLIFFVSAVFSDLAFYKDFFTMRTTRGGLSMGGMIGLFLVILVGVNYLGAVNNKVFDITEEKLHSLSDQTVKVINNLKNPVDFLVFYRGGKDKDAKAQIKYDLEKYQDVSAKIKVRFVNSYLEQMVAEKYLKDVPDNDKIVIFAEQGANHIRVMDPFKEESFTSAIVRVTRSSVKKIYLVAGHGERDINSAEPEGLSSVKKSLEESSYQVAPLNLLETRAIPADADAIAIIGPEGLVSDEEVRLLVEYGKKGGRLLVAADPGKKHGLNRLLEPFGIDFKNNYVVSDRPLIVGRGQATILGAGYDHKSDITKNMDQLTLFDVVSELGKTKTAPASYRYVELIKTPPNSLVINELKEAAVKNPEIKSYVIAAMVEGMVDEVADPKNPPKADEKKKEFAIVAFGDSDFASEKNFSQGMNRDLILNSISYLAKETDLVSIRPKQPKGTKLELTSVKAGMIKIAGVGMPILLAICSLILWFVRRGA